METLASIWQALVDSDAFWMIDEIAWPLIQSLGILLALLVATLLVALLSYHFGDDDEDEEEEVDPINATCGLNMVDWDAVNYNNQLSMYLNDEGPAPSPRPLRDITKGSF